MFFNIFTKKYNFFKFDILIYASIIVGKNKITDEIYIKLFDIIKEIYGKNTNKIIKSVKEQVNKSKKDTCGIDMILKEIVYYLKTRPELKDRINFALLIKLINENDIVSSRVFDFLVEEVKECERKKLF